MKIYLIRHGQTDWNIQQRFQGREDIPLNEVGILQAVECGNALKGDYFKAVITSPLTRASKTAEIIADIVSAEQFIIEKQIIERDFSRVSGMTPREREIFYASGEKDDKEPWDILCHRMVSCIKHYGEQFKSNNIIMVSHGATINSVLSVLSAGKTGTGKIRLKNTCINILYYDKGQLSLGEYNLTAEEYLILKSKKKV
jgi:broad specificity phosphatase PhoE